MKKASLFIAPVFVLLLTGSCSEALHRDIPKAKGHYQRRELTDDFREQAVADEQVAEAIVPAEPTDRTEAVSVPEVREQMLRPEIPDETSGQKVTVSRQQIIIAAPQGDTATVEEDIDEAILDEAFESERIARQAYHFSFLPILTLVFFPMLFVGLIGTLSKLARFKRYEYVTEKGLDYERRAKRTLIASIFIPLVAVLFFILVLFVLL
jgi:hypothetical protein